MHASPQQHETILAHDAVTDSSTGRHAVVIVGGGPTGMMLAGELALAGVDVAIVERGAGGERAAARAGGLQARTLELLDQRGIVDRFLAEGQVAQVTGYGGIRLDISDLSTRHAYGLALWQKHVERLLAEWIAGLRVTVHHGKEVTGFAQDTHGVDVQLADGGRLRAGYLVGCDGGRSTIRKAAGIGFPGWDASTSQLIGEVEMTTQPPLGIHRKPDGVYAFGKLEYRIRDDGQIEFAQTGPVRVMVPERQPGKGTPTLEDLRAPIVEAFGTDYGMHSPRLLSRFTDMARQAERYRVGRVLLAGDAAHVHSPVGGQGLNLGMQDAVNLGWKLARVVAGTAPESLLDSYQAERHPVAARVLADTLGQVALLRTDDRTEALREAVAEMLRFDAVRRRFGARMSGLDIRYDFGEGHPLLGCRMPDIDLVTAEGKLRAYALLHAAQPLLLNVGRAGSIDAGPWANRVRLVEARCDGPWELPAAGAIPAPAALLVRPDGHVAWVGEGDDTGLAGALATWFGPPGT
jgi:3-(3-hydroxy-phenyl)propionate hydroxylase